MAARTDLLTEKLKELELSSPDIKGAVITSSEGFILASVLPAGAGVGTDVTLVAAVSARMLSAAERCVTELDTGRLSEVYVKGSEGYTLMKNIRENAVLKPIGTGNIYINKEILDVLFKFQPLSSFFLNIVKNYFKYLA